MYSLPYLDLKIGKITFKLVEIDVNIKYHVANVSSLKTMLLRHVVTEGKTEDCKYGHYFTTQAFDPTIILKGQIKVMRSSGYLGAVSET